MEKRIALSWSGGKDGCMALDRLIREGHKVACLVTTVPAELGRTFGHGERLELIRMQAEALAIPLHFIECAFEEYTNKFINSLIELKEQYALTDVAYGDLYLDEHRQWGEDTAAKAGLTPLYPLWMKKEQSLHALEKFVNSGYQAVVIRVRDELLSEDWLGRELNNEFVNDIAKENVCPMGEAGEYHTFVYDGPLFKKRIELKAGEIVQLETTKRLEFNHFRFVD
ncbi:hypothetical protein CU633_04480 [Bacillus sp. V3-13]|uniref:Dph6-related ATP pyrophosphatase n=1 Tax=Bacillus sp. V3-13 TaxID=2053728 RepID=UPI000C769EB8|nr:diphthine--ammonia ligase [Bacillus sp. V3-13]PLR78490.1 hypothetical protein CU633_04480 [Bacillus sp. V3-13]